MATTHPTTAPTTGPGRFHSAGPLPAPMRRPLVGWSVRDGLVVMRRHLIQTLRVPELLFFSIVQPVMFVLLFAYVFGGAIPVPGTDGPPDAALYRSFLIPGIFAQTITFAAANSTVGLAEDMHKGIVDRFRSLPMAASAVLWGRTAADAARMTLVLLVLSITGLLVGWRIEDGILRAAGAYALLLLFAYALAWIGAWVGLHMKTPEVANTAGLIWLFPVSFLSSAFVPLNGMPDWLRVVAEWNPVSSLALSCRQLFGNPTGLIPPSSEAWPMQNPVLWTVLSCLVLIAIFATLAVRRYRRVSAR